MNVVDVDGLPVVVREWGAREARALVFWHGLSPSGPLALIEAGPAWAERGFRVLAPSGPGMGETPALPHEEMRPAALARLVLRLADAFGIDRFDYVGFSWGATIGCRLAGAALARLRSLVLLDDGYDEAAPVVPPLDDVVARLRAETVGYAFPTWEAFLERVRPGYRRWCPALEERVRSGMVERDGRIVPRVEADVAAAAYHGVLAEPPQPAWPALAALAAPLLVVVSGDPLGPTHAFRRAVPNAEVHAVGGAGHDLLADAPDETVALVADWLDCHSE